MANFSLNPDMSWEPNEGASFLNALPDESTSDDKRVMFRPDAQKNLTAEQAKKAAYAKIEADSEAALSDLRAGVRVNQFMPALKKVLAFKLNEKDEQVALFLEKLTELCVKVSAVESKVLLLEEEVIIQHKCYLLK